MGVHKAFTRYARGGYNPRVSSAIELAAVAVAAATTFGARKAIHKALPLPKVSSSSNRGTLKVSKTYSDKRSKGLIGISRAKPLGKLVHRIRASRAATGGGGAWDESKHPRGADGKFA